jgi:hypothetical protein
MRSSPFAPRPSLLSRSAPGLVRMSVSTRPAQPGPLPTPERLAVLLARDTSLRDRVLAAAAAIVQVLSERPGLSLRKLRTAVRAALGRCTDSLTDAAVELLGAGVHREHGERGAYRYTLDADKIPNDVRADLAKRPGS